MTKRHIDIPYIYIAYTYIHTTSFKWNWCVGIESKHFQLNIIIWKHIYYTSFIVDIWDSRKSSLVEKRNWGGEKKKNKFRAIFNSNRIYIDFQFRLCHRYITYMWLHDGVMKLNGMNVQMLQGKLWWSELRNQ